MTHIRPIAIALFLSFSLAAQTSGIIPAPSVTSAVSLEIIALEEEHNRARREVEERKAAEFEKQRFEAEMNSFVLAWNEFANEYIEKKTFNLKKARSLAKAMRKMEGKLPH